MHNTEHLLNSPFSSSMKTLSCTLHTVLVLDLETCLFTGNTRHLQLLRSANS